MIKRNLKRNLKINVKIIFIFFFLQMILFNNELSYFIKFFFNFNILSIIIPVYNDEKYLSLCIQSILKQSLKNIEIICIDDGSTDNSFKILKKYATLDYRLLILYQKNFGPAIARNRGIKICKGKFIAFMDSDDFYPNDFTLELMYNNIIKNKVLICGGGLRRFTQKKKKIIFFEKNDILFQKNGIINYSNYQYDYFYQRFIYNKNFLKKNKIYFPNYLRYQDPPFFIKAMGMAKKFYSLKNHTYMYRIMNKIVKYNKRKIIDIYKGIRDSLFLSQQMNLNKLYCSILNRLNDDLFINGAKKYIKHKELKYIISKILKSINKKILRKQNFKFVENKFYKNLKFKQ